MVKTAYYLLKTARPRQWLKNVALFAALLFSGFLFVDGYFLRVLWAFVIFCVLASSIYIFNDILDAPQDKKHPFKKKRPIPSGLLPIPVALFAGSVGLITALVLARSMSFFFFFVLLTYLLVNLSYSLFLKHVPILDVLTIAAGFVLRVYAGAAVVNLHMNVWFLLTVVNLSLFLAVGKRQSERTLLQGLKVGLEGQRSTLSHYSTRLLDIYTGMFATATWFAYALFAYQQQFLAIDGPLPTFFSLVPRTFVSQKLLMITVPVVIYGVMRYLQLVYEQNRGESPERVLLSDRPLLTAVLLYGAMVITILYGIV
jgi:decaprenyl-phosphate phosphoribosyltransferase